MEILTTLTDRGLLHYDGKTRTYKTTDKGFRALQAYNEISELMKGIEQGKVITRHIVSEVN
jgi:predicted transcriptional regulator